MGCVRGGEKGGGGGGGVGRGRTGGRWVLIKGSQTKTACLHCLRIQIVIDKQRDKMYNLRLFYAQTGYKNQAAVIH